MNENLVDSQCCGTCKHSFECAGQLSCAVKTPFLRLILIGPDTVNKNGICSRWKSNIELIKQKVR